MLQILKKALLVSGQQMQGLPPGPRPHPRGTASFRTKATRISASALAMISRCAAAASAAAAAERLQPALVALTTAVAAAR